MVPASLALNDGRALHGADRGHHTNRLQRRGAAEAAGRVAHNSLRVEPPILDSALRTTLFSGARGRARVLFSRAVGVEYPTGHLLCEFEVGLSLKIALTRGYKKTVKNLKRTPVF